jgi:hypothetical protein
MCGDAAFVIGRTSAMAIELLNTVLNAMTTLLRRTTNRTSGTA